MFFEVVGSGTVPTDLVCALEITFVAIISALVINVEPSALQLSQLEILPYHQSLLPDYYHNMYKDSYYLLKLVIKTTHPLYLNL